MKRPFSSQESKQLLRQYTEQLKTLRWVEGLQNEKRDEIERTVNGMLGENAIELLKQIPIDNINRKKQRIRVKTLKNAHYHTIGDLVGASQQQLSRINGISPEMAWQIRNEVREFWQEAVTGGKVRLNADHKDAASTKLVLELTQYRKSLPYIEACQSLLTRYETDVEKELKNLRHGTNRLIWFFTSRENKEKAVQAYQYLTQLAQEDYGKKIQENAEALGNLLRMTPEQAWEFFEEDPIALITTLERVVPNVIDHTDAAYGLPEQLAQDIEQESLEEEGLLCTLRRYQEQGVKYIS